MRKIKFGRALGLSLLSALSLMAVFAGGAQATADPGSFWVGELGKFLLATFTGTQEGAGSLLVPGRSLTITCNAGHVNSGHLKTSTLGLAKVTFLECATFSHPGGGALTACTVGKEKGKPESIVATADLLPFLHLEGGIPTNLNYVTAEPDESANFTEIVLSGSTCAIKGTYAVTGSISAEIKPALSEPTHPIVNLIEATKAFSELVKDSLSFGAFSAFVIAKAEIELTGEHKGIKFGVV